MNWLKRRPGSRRAPAGLEWMTWRSLPMLALAGLRVPASVWVTLKAVFLEANDPAAAETARWVERTGYALLGYVVLHFSLLAAIAIGCIVVMVMKGPGYEADPYPLLDAERPAPGRRSEHGLDG